MKRFLSIVVFMCLFLALCSCRSVESDVPVEENTDSSTEEVIFHIPETDHGVFSKMTATPEITNIVAYMDSVYLWFAKNYPEWADSDWHDNGSYLETGMEYNGDRESFYVTVSVAYKDLDPVNQTVKLHWDLKDACNLENEIIARVDDYFGVKFDIEEINLALKSNDVTVLECDNCYMGVKKYSHSSEWDYCIEVYMCDASDQLLTMKNNASN